MYLFSLTQEKIDELEEKLKNKEEELAKIQATTEIDQWKIELEEFVNQYKSWTTIEHEVSTKLKIKKKL